MPVNIFSMITEHCLPVRSPDDTLRITSETPNMPIMAGMKLNPFMKFVLPKVKRGKPNVSDTPTVVIIRPISREIRPLAKEPLVTRTAQESPMQANQKYS